MPLTTSVVLCTYNGARFLPEQWASLLAQSRLPDEIVARDDASTDRTPDLLVDVAAEAEARGIGVRFFRGERNLGYVANFEAALRAASGDVLFLCDQDDIWRAEKLAVQALEFERRSGLLLLSNDARRIDEDGTELGRTLFEVLRVKRDELARIHAGRGFEVLLRRSMATGATIALRRTLLGDALPFPKGWVHDEWLAIIAASLGGFDCLEAPLIDYRQHESNQLGMRDRAFREKWIDLREPRPDLIDLPVARDEQLLRRLRRLDRKPDPGFIDRAIEKLEHLRVRQGIAGPPWRRIGAILRETANGHYLRYGSGWRSALRDLVRRV